MSKGRCLGNIKSCQQSPFHTIMLLDNCKDKLQVFFWFFKGTLPMFKVTEDDK